MADCTNAVSESNEGDNAWQGSFYWNKASGCNTSCQQMLDQWLTLTNGQTVQAKNLSGTVPVKGMDATCAKPGQFPFGSECPVGSGKYLPSSPVTSNSNNRYGDLLKAVIHQFGVNTNPRYTPGTYYGIYTTFCNTFAGDVARAMGSPLPTKQEYTGSGVDKATINADNLFNWFTGSNSGKTTTSIQRGWREVNATTADGLNQLVAHVNAGKLAIATIPGHIAVIRPGQGTVTRFSDLRVAQAGGTNNSNIALSQGFGSSTPRFFIHD